MGLTPTNPTVSYLLENIQNSENLEVRNLSTRVLIILLQVPSRFRTAMLSQCCRNDPHSPRCILVCLLLRPAD